MPKRTEGPGPNPGGLCQCGCGQQTALAESSSKRHGSVKGQPLRYVYGHYQRRQNPLDQYREEDRGYGTPCHIWTGAISTQLGYGIYSSQYAHILAFRKAKGPIPRGHVVHHLCEQKLCVRPEHLEVVSRSKHPSLHAKVDAALWEEIRAATGTTRQVAARYGISKTHAWLIKSGRQPQPLP